MPRTTSASGDLFFHGPYIFEGAQNRSPASRPRAERYGSRNYQIVDGGDMADTPPSPLLPQRRDAREKACQYDEPAAHVVNR